MEIGKYKIVKQIGEYGIFGEITLACSVTVGDNMISIKCPEELKRWYPGVLFGATYVFEHTRERINMSIEVIQLLAMMWILTMPLSAI